MQLPTTRNNNSIKLPNAGFTFGQPNNIPSKNQLEDEIRSGNLQKMSETTLTPAPMIAGYKPQPAFTPIKLPQRPESMPITASTNNMQPIKSTAPSIDPIQSNRPKMNMPSISDSMNQYNDQFKQAQESYMQKTLDIVSAIKTEAPEKTKGLTDDQIFTRFLKKNPQAVDELFSEENEVFKLAQQQGRLTKSGKLLQQQAGKVDANYNPVTYLAKIATQMIGGGIEGAGRVQDAMKNVKETALDTVYTDILGVDTGREGTGRTAGQNLVDLTAGGVQLATTVLPVARAGNAIKAGAQMVGFGALLNATPIGDAIGAVARGATNTADFVLDYVPGYKEFKESIPQESRAYMQEAVGMILAGQLLNTRIVKGKNPAETVKLTVQNSLNGKNIRNNFKEQFDNVPRGDFGGESVMGRTFGLAGDTISGAVKLASGKYNVRQKTSSAINKGTDIAVAQTTGQDVENIERGSRNKDLADQAVKGDFNENTMATELDDIVRSMDQKRSEAGSAYETLYESKQKLSGDDIVARTGIEDMGISIDENGKVRIDPKEYVAKSGERTQIQQAYNIMKSIEGQELTVQQAHNVRKSIDNLITYGDITKQQSEAVRAMRDRVDEMLKDNVQGRREVDETYSKTSKEVQGIINEFFVKDKESKYRIKSDIYNKFKGSMNDPQFTKKLEKLEKIMPGASDKIRAIKYAKDFQKAKANKVGTYTKTAITTAVAGGLGYAVGGPIGALALGVAQGYISTPGFLMNVLQSLRKQSPNSIKARDSGTIDKTVRKLLSETAKKVYLQNNKLTKAERRDMKAKVKAEAKRMKIADAVSKAVESLLNPKALPERSSVERGTKKNPYVGQDQRTDAMKKEAEERKATRKPVYDSMGGVDNALRDKNLYYEDGTKVKSIKKSMFKPFGVQEATLADGRTVKIDKNGLLFKKGESAIVEQKTIKTPGKPEDEGFIPMDITITSPELLQQGNKPIKVPKQTQEPKKLSEMTDTEFDTYLEKNIDLDMNSPEMSAMNKERERRYGESQNEYAGKLEELTARIDMLTEREQRIGKVGRNTIKDGKYKRQQQRGHDKEYDAIIEEISQFYNLDANQAYDKYLEIQAGTKFRTREQNTASLRKKYQIREQAGEAKSSLITKEKAQAEINKYFYPGEVSTRFVENISTPRGQEAFGSYMDGAIELVNNTHKTTPSHEALHAYLDLFSSDMEKSSVLADVKKKQGMKNDLEAEEYLADNFYEYIQSGKGVTGSVKRFFSKVREGMKSLFGQQDKVTELYENILQKKRPKAEKKIKTPGQTKYEQDGVSDKYTMQPLIDIAKEIKGETIKKTTLEGMMNRQNYKKPEKEAIQKAIDMMKGDDMPKALVIEAIRSDIIPLNKVETDKYAGYNKLFKSTGKEKTWLFNANQPITDPGNTRNHFSDPNLYSRVRIDQVGEGANKKLLITEMQSDYFQDKLSDNKIYNNKILIEAMNAKRGEKNKSFEYFDINDIFEGGTGKFNESIEEVIEASSKKELDLNDLIEYNLDYFSSLEISTQIKTNIENLKRLSKLGNSIGEGDIDNGFLFSRVDGDIVPLIDENTQISPRSVKKSIKDQYDSNMKTLNFFVDKGVIKKEVKAKLEKQRELIEAKLDSKEVTDAINQMNSIEKNYGEVRMRRTANEMIGNAVKEGFKKVMIPYGPTVAMIEGHRVNNNPKTHERLQEIVTDITRDEAFIRGIAEYVKERYMEDFDESDTILYGGVEYTPQEMTDRGYRKKYVASLSGRDHLEDGLDTIFGIRKNGNGEYFVNDPAMLQEGIDRLPSSSDLKGKIEQYIELANKTESNQSMKDPAERKNVIAGLLPQHQTIANFYEKNLIPYMKKQFPGGVDTEYEGGLFYEVDISSKNPNEPIRVYQTKKTPEYKQDRTDSKGNSIDVSTAKPGDIIEGMGESFQVIKNDGKQLKAIPEGTINKYNEEYRDNYNMGKDPFVKDMIRIGVPKSEAIEIWNESVDTVKKEILSKMETYSIEKPSVIKTPKYQEVSSVKKLKTYDQLKKDGAKFLEYGENNEKWKSDVKGIIKHLTNEEKRVIGDYVAGKPEQGGGRESYFADMNKALRGLYLMREDTKYREELENDAKIMSEGLKKIPSKKTKTRRGMTDYDNEVGSLFVKGKTFTDKGFTSTSDSIRTAFGFAGESSQNKYIIEVEGKTYDIGNVSEGEYIMDKGSTFIVEDIKQGKDALGIDPEIDKNIKYYNNKVHYIKLKQIEKSIKIPGKQ